MKHICQHVKGGGGCFVQEDNPRACGNPARYFCPTRFEGIYVCQSCWAECREFDEMRRKRWGIPIPEKILV
jgi:hypothetical protein